MSEEGWVPYARREEWSDVAPVEQDDGPDPVVAIAYSPQYVDAMNYFRAVLMADERSERALRLTRDAIKFNPANYTAWHFRRLCLEATGTDLGEEMEYTAEMAMQTPKNYQIWFHRRWLVAKANDSSQEKRFTAAAIEQDSKNYHAWAHRQWAVSEYGLWEGELEFTERLLGDDVRNNSVWNHRYFVLSGGGQGEVSLVVARREVEFALHRLTDATHNESAASFIRGFVQQHGEAQFPELVPALRALARGTTPDSAVLTALMADLLAARGRAGDGAAREEARELYQRLAETVDPIRSKYWQWTAEELRSGEAEGVFK